jgi:hypothetical protein
MTEKPITPTRIIPAGAALPARPPEEGELPPWRQPPPAPPAPPPPPPAAPPARPEPEWHGPGAYSGPIEVFVTFLPVPTEPEPTRWERLRAWAAAYGRPWQALAAITLSVSPILPHGYSAATTWHYVVSEARDSFGIGPGYAVGGIPLAVAVLLLIRRGGTTLRLVGLVVFSFGLLGAMSWYDPVTLITGVHK